LYNPEYKKKLYSEQKETVFQIYNMERVFWKLWGARVIELQEERVHDETVQLVYGTIYLRMVR